MEQLDPARLSVTGHPTDTELAALVCVLEGVAAGSGLTDSPDRPRVWPRTSWRTHAHQLHAALPPGTDPGHRHVAVHPLEES